MHSNVRCHSCSQSLSINRKTMTAQEKVQEKFLVRVATQMIKPPVVEFVKNLHAEGKLTANKRPPTVVRWDPAVLLPSRQQPLLCQVKATEKTTWCVVLRIAPYGAVRANTSNRFIQCADCICTGTESVRLCDSSGMCQLAPDSVLVPVQMLCFEIRSLVHSMA